MYNMFKNTSSIISVFGVNFQKKETTAEQNFDQNKKMIEKQRQNSKKNKTKLYVSETDIKGVYSVYRRAV